MSEVTIQYSRLESAADSAGRLARELSSYSGELSSKVKQALAALPGSDSCGYISSASTQVGRKMQDLTSLSSQFSTLSSDLERFSERAKSADERVAKSIKSTASSYVGERNWFEAACDAVYNCLFVDVANSNSFTRFLFDCGKYAWNRGEELVSSVYNWFKHGDGRYVWNITIAVVGAAAAIAGAALTVMSGGIFLFAAAAVIGAAITTVNAAVKFYNNAKALNEDDPGVALYLGNIGGVSDAIEKYDLGDAEDNAAWKRVGDGVDTVKAGCDILGIVNAAVNLGAVKDSATGLTKSYKFTKSNIIKNLRSSVGYDAKLGKYTLKGFIGDFGLKSTDKVKNIVSLSNTTKVFINGIIFTNNVMTTMEKGDKVFSNLKDGLDFSTPETTAKEVASTVVDIYSALGKFKLFKGINQFTVTPYKAYEDLGEIYYPELVGAT